MTKNSTWYTVAITYILVVLFSHPSMAQDPGGKTVERSAVDACAAVEVLCHRQTERTQLLQAWESNWAIDPAFVNATDFEGRTPLHHAVAEGWTEGVGWLLRHGAKPNVLDRRGVAPINLVRDVDILQLLLARGADVDKVPEFGRSVLCSIVDMGDVIMLHTLLFAAHTLNLDGNDAASGYTALGDAARSGNLQVARQLIEFGADPFVPDARGRFVAAIAAQSGHQDVFRFLTALKAPEMGATNQIVLGAVQAELWGIEGPENHFRCLVGVRHHNPSQAVISELATWGIQAGPIPAQQASMQSVPFDDPSFCVSIEEIQWLSQERVVAWCRWAHTCTGIDKIELRLKNGRWVPWDRQNLAVTTTADGTASLPAIHVDCPTHTLPLGLRSLVDVETGKECHSTARSNPGGTE